MKYLILLFSVALFACNHGAERQAATLGDSLIPTPDQSVANFSKVIGWKKGKTPVAPDGSLLVADDASNTIWKVSKE